MLADRFLTERIRIGTLNVEFDGGGRSTYGSGEPVATIRLRGPKVLERIAADPQFMLGQAYMDGEWSAPDGLFPLLDLLMRNFPPESERQLSRLGRSLRLPLQQWNRIRASRRNVKAHYDLDEQLFRQFLDSDMHYSCAYFATPEQTLEQAQQNKCELIRRKLALRPGQSVLDIGCGWGSLAMYLAEHADVSVTGITLSREQYRVAQERIRERGLQERVTIRLEDYREHHGAYDRVVSVGMLEHIGAPFLRRYFETVAKLLKKDGVALIHTIGRYTPPSLTNSWIRRYIFPGGYIPAASEVTTAIERGGLILSDLEVLRHHYAHTLLEWLRRFQEVRESWASQRGESFCRMWEFYLASSAASFLQGSLVVFQFQLIRDLAALPITRDYMCCPPITAEQHQGGVVSTRSPASY